jgi:hypothetical protein
VPLPSHSPIPSLPSPQLPFNDAPEAFGLHENANITSAINETNLLLGTALSLQPKSAEGVGLSWDQMLTQLSVDIESRLPALFDNAQGDIDFPVRYDESMNTVLTQELIRFNNLTARLKVGCDEMARCHAVHLHRWPLSSLAAAATVLTWLLAPPLLTPSHGTSEQKHHRPA